jgi:hypothetical protein
VSLSVYDDEMKPLADYPAEYVSRIDAAYPPDQWGTRRWIVTAKGLFRATTGHAHGWSAEDLARYYNTDEAVRELEERLKGAGQ